MMVDSEAQGAERVTREKRIFGEGKKKKTFQTETRKRSEKYYVKEKSKEPNHEGSHWDW